jgi:predicted amidohydrolase
LSTQDIRDIVELGEPGQRGNLLGIQPYMRPADYLSAESFSLRLNTYLDAAQQRGWLTDHTVVVFPEYLGAWLVAVGEGPRVHRADDVGTAMRSLAMAHPLAWLGRWLGARARDRSRAALFALKAEEMTAAYQSTFSLLARTYGITIVAGSILLPSPRLEGGRLVSGKGPLANVSAVYRFDGAAVGLSRKVYPTADEVPFVAPGKLSDLPVLNTPCGKMGVLVCADSWYPAPYQVLRSKGAEIVVVVSFTPGDGAWDRPWAGYSGQAAPDDVDPAHVGALTEGEAWVRYAMIGRIDSSEATYGMNVFLRGRLWDLGSDGCAMVVRGEETYQLERVNGAALVNCWL